jgi:ABC-type sugar transport system, periplasmic component
MKKMKNVMSIFLVAVMMFMLVACAGNGNNTEETTSGESEAATDAMSPLTISGFVAEPNDYQKKMIELFEEEYPDLKVETVIADTNAREQVLKTAISAGDPPNIGFYWGTRVSTFYENDMLLDLREYFTEEELSLFDEAMMEPCLGPNGEVFAIPLSTVYFTTFYNKDMMEEYGFEIPETWADMTAIFERLKEDGIMGFSTNSASMQDCLYGITYAELEARVGKDTAYGIANGDVSVLPGTPAGEIIRECIELVQGWYDAGYWYPGEAGINTTQDDGNAGFAQERVLFNFNFSGALATLEGLCDFEIGSFMKPTSESGMVSYENIEPDVYFIPANATQEQINSSIAFLKLGLQQEVQQAIVDSNNVPSIMSYEFSNMSENLEEIMSKFDGGGLQAGLNPTRTSSEMQTFIKTVIFAGPLSGTMSIDDALNEMEALRLAANN